ncbi:MAG: class I SAM-dependent methyltransferase, partial [Planctomycetota bacterium]
MQPDEVYDRMAAADHPLCRPAVAEDLKNPLPILDPLGWLSDSIRGQNVLCLAAGGGKHGVMYAAAGATVTVVDISAAMLQHDLRASQQFGLQVRRVQASMDDLSMLSPASFDIVVHPVSTCYVPEIRPVFDAVATVLRPGGLYVSQHKTPTSLQASIHRGPDQQFNLRHSYYRRQPIPPLPAEESQSSAGRRLREP